jgi:predicted exporter
MATQSRRFNLPLALATVLALSTMGIVGWSRITIDNDIVATLPQKDPVIAAARDVIRHHPAQDRVVVDIEVVPADREALLAAGDRVAAALRASGLFAQVGLGDAAAGMPALMAHVADRLPQLFSARELEEAVAPRLAPEAVARRLADARDQLNRLESIGQAALIARDPLGLRLLVLKRLAALAPAPDLRFVGGHLLSADGRHLLITAKPAGSGTDTAFGRRARDLFDRLEADLAQEVGGGERQVHLTPVGAYRAALDNETMAKSDMQKVVWCATAGITLLLFLTFPRPWIGLLAFLPALAGTVGALFVMSLFYRSLSMLTLGFGGAVIAITVDHGIAYLLFLDQPRETRGKEAAHEVRAVGLLATLTTAGAFLTLSLSGFAVLAQVGLFAACGISLAFVFVHTVFPYLVPSLPPARRRTRPPLQALLARLTRRAGGKTMLATLALGLGLGLFARLDFHIDLRAMNSVAPATRQAEDRLQQTWGNLFQRVFVMARADDLAGLMQANDRLTPRLKALARDGALESVFTVSALFPGPDQAAANQAAWRAFWTPHRVAGLRTALTASGAALGFANQAFAPFLTLLEAPPQAAPSLPPASLFEMLGILPGTGGDGWRQFYALQPGPNYRAADLAHALGAAGDWRMFDPAYFAARLGAFLGTVFKRMIVIVGASAVVLLAVFFADLSLTLLALLPLGFALISTLGVLGLMGRPLDIPALMLAIVVLGMGIDYAIFTVSAYQRYGDEDDPALGLFRTTVFLAAASTLVGFASLMAARHAVFRSAGLTSFLGIGFAFVGAFALLPYPLRRLYRPKPTAAQHLPPAVAVRRRFRHLELRVRLAARRLLKPPPLPAEMPLDPPMASRVLIFPVGWGVEAAWIVHTMPASRIMAADPAPEAARVAARVLGNSHQVTAGPWAALAAAPAATTVLLREPPAAVAAWGDMLREAFHRLAPGGRLIVLRPARPSNEDAEACMAAIARAGFSKVKAQPSRARAGVCWFSAERTE